MSFALAALTFGLVAGLKPGPLGIFVIHETLTNGLRRGFLSSLAPIITDGPIILLALLLTNYVREVDWFISLISLIGSIYLAHLSYKIYRAPKGISPSGSGRPSGILTAVKINFLNPAPYLFWLTIGSSYILLGSALEAGIFISLSLLSLCLVKFMVALAIKQLGDRFSPRMYSVLLRSLSLPLLLFSCQLMYSGLELALMHF